MVLARGADSRETSSCVSDGESLLFGAVSLSVLGAAAGFSTGFGNRECFCQCGKLNSAVLVGVRFFAAVIRKKPCAGGSSCERISYGIVDRLEHRSFV